jgi:hypothetical protein
VFASEGQAKRFFVERIVARAAAEGHPLSDAERRMLSFSESDPDFIVDQHLVEQLAAEISDDEYENKVAGLIERAFEEDTGRDRRAVDVYGEAYNVLNRGDHYLLIMLSGALGRRLRPWWALWR